MKNLLLLTILLGTIACQGSNGPGAPIVEKGPDKTLTKYPVFSDVYGTSLQQCMPEENEISIIECFDNGLYRPTTFVEHYADVSCGDPSETVNVELKENTNVEKFECKDLGEDRPISDIDYYSTVDFEIACEDSETLTTVFTCNPVTTTNDIRAFETITQVQIMGYDSTSINNDNEYRIVQADDVGIIFKDKGQLQGINTYENLWPTYYKWELQNDKLFIFKKNYNNSYGWIKVADEGLKVTRD